MGEPISISISASIGQVKFEYNSPHGAVLKSTAAPADIVLKILSLVKDITESDSIVSGVDEGPNEQGGYTYAVGGVNVHQPELDYIETVMQVGGESMRSKNDKMLAEFLEDEGPKEQGGYTSGA